MKMLRKQKFWAHLPILLSAIAVLVAGPAVEASESAALGDDGTLYRVHAGLYGDLFPGGGETAAEDFVLAVDIVPPEGEALRQLVPASLGSDREEVVGVFFEDRSHTLYFAWVGVGETGSHFQVSGLRGEESLPVILVADGVHPRPGSLRFGLTRDAYLPVANAPPDQVVERTVLHLVWWDEAPGSPVDDRVLYSPVILLEGEYLGWSPVVELNELDPYDGTDAVELPAVERAPTLEPGRAAGGWIVAFNNPASGHLATVEILPLPGEIGRISQDVAETILGREVGAVDVEVFGGEVRGTIMDISRDLHPAHRAYLAQQIQEWVIQRAYNPELPGIVLQDLADGVRGTIMDISSTFYGSEGRSRFFDPQRLRLLQVFSDPQGNDEVPSEMPHIIRLYLVRERITPQRHEEGSAVLVSEDGKDSLVVWEEEGALRYRETVGDEWSEVRTLPLDDTFTRAEGEAVLRERVRDR